MVVLTFEKEKTHTVPDVSLVSKTNNKVLAVAEGKKPDKLDEEWDNIFGSNTHVAGEVFEQMMVTKIQSLVILEYSSKRFLVCVGSISSPEVGGTMIWKTSCIPYSSQCS